jgi:GNAT superfamily N-acetyltransferase
VTELDERALLATYDRELRARVPDPPPDGMTVERDGPLIRLRGYLGRGFLTYPDLGGLTGADLDALIQRQVEIFAALGEPVEWKLHGHDEPADLADRLLAAGFEPEERETVVIGRVTLPAAEPPDGVRLREVTARADLDRIARMESVVWGVSRSDWAAMLEKEIAADPDAIAVVVAEAGGEVVSAGWLRYEGDTPFASLWGGSTLAQWRRRGIYRALVSYRARLAAARGRTLLQVDASDDSRPILQRLGFVPVTTTTPYVFTPMGVR